MDTMKIVVEQTEVAGFPALVAQPPPGVPRLATVACLHGAFSDHTGFAGWLPLLAAAGHPAYAVARRGRLGVGPERAAGLSVSDYLDDTLAAVDALSDPPVLLGHSLGGLLAQKAAEAGRGRALVLLAPAPPRMLTAQAVALPGYLPNLPRIMAGRPFLVSGNACTRLALNEVPAEQRPALHATLVPESGKVYRSMMFGTVRVDRRKVGVPVLVLGGDRDRVVSRRLLRATARHYGAELRMLPGHAHWLLGEPGSEAIAAQVVGWLRGLG